LGLGKDAQNFLLDTYQPLRKTGRRYQPMLNAQRNDHCIAFRVLPFVSATQRMTKTRVNALTTMYERKLLAQKLKGKKKLHQLPWFRILSYSDFRAEAQRCGVDLQHSR
jgi:hypothetical protein